MSTEASARAVRLSIIIPVYNTPKDWLLEAIASTEQVPGDLHEVILVDDGSTSPDTAEAISQIRARGFRVLQVPNGGCGAARNRGIEQAIGEYILPLDADDRLMPDFPRAAMDVLDSNSEVEVVGGAVETFGAGVSRMVPPAEFTLTNLFTQNQISASSMFRRKSWASVGGYDEHLRLAPEDLEFWIRIAARGGKIVGLPQTAIEYRVGHSSLTTSQVNIDGHPLADAVVANNSDYAPLLWASIGANETLRPQLPRVYVMQELWERYRYLDAAIGRVPGLQRLLAEANHLARRLAAKRRHRDRSAG